MRRSSLELERASAGDPELICAAYSYFSHGTKPFRGFALRAAGAGARRPDPRPAAASAGSTAHHSEPFQHTLAHTLRVREPARAPARA